MKIKFIFNDIKNIELIYQIEEVWNEEWGENILKRSYVGSDYSKEIVETVCKQYSDISNVVYRGQTGRIASEEFEICTINRNYAVVFTYDTFDDAKSQTQVTVTIETDSTDGTDDVLLEKIKIQIKQMLVKDWKICTWIVDEQSECISINLYGKIYALENKIRAFVNVILIEKFGVLWRDCIGFEKIVESHQKNQVDFKREVPEFNNINDILISTTIETLSWLIFKAEVFEENIPIGDSENVILHRKLLKKNPNTVFDYIASLRKVKYNIWEDVFQKYFLDCNLERCMTIFIKNRNHIAHNKLLTISAGEKIARDIQELDAIFDRAFDMHTQETPSDELCETWQIEQERYIAEEEHIRYLIKNDTGVEVRTSNEIFCLFKDALEEVYNSIDDNAYFNYSVQVESYKNVEDCLDEQLFFVIVSNVNESFNISIFFTLNIDETMDSESCMHLCARRTDGKDVLNTTVRYYNGGAHYDYEQCCYVADSESFFEKSKMHDFIEELKFYVESEMNSIKSKIDELSFTARKDGGCLPVADFPCYNCNQNYVSINDDLFPFGHCANCGEINEIGVCVHCESIYMLDDGNDDLCGYCYEKFLNE